MKKHVGMFILFIISGCASTPASEEAMAKMAVIHAVGSQVIIVSVDGNPFTGLRTTTVSPGPHRIDLGKTSVACNTLAGHRYEVSPSGCSDKGLTEAAQNVEKRRNAAQELRDTEKYQEYKQALSSPQDEAYLRRMRFDIESKRGGFQNDPDNLLPIINQQLAPYVESEQKRAEAQQKRKEAEVAETARQKAIRDKEIARQQAIYEKEQAAKAAAERKRIALFRDSLKEGDETNCGPSVEAKAKLVKVAHAVANYGTEHWIRRDSLFPPGYGCSFFNGVYQPPQ